MLSNSHETIPVLGSLGSIADTAELKDWLKPFPSSICEAVGQWLASHADRTWVVQPAPELSRFRMTSLISVGQVTRTLSWLWSHLESPGFIFWAFENHDNRGLDDFEVEAVLGTFIDVEFLHQIDRGAPVSRIAVGGRLREEVIGLTFRITPEDLNSRAKLHDGLMVLLQSQMPVTTLFLDHEVATALNQEPRSETTLLIRRVLEHCSTAPGLEVPRGRIAVATKDLNREVAPLRNFADDSLVDHIRFSDSEVLNSPEVFETIRQANFKYDSSISIRHWPWKRSPRPYIEGVYQPQTFDYLIPSGLWDPDRLLECPVSESVPEDLGARKRNARLER